MSKKQKKTTSKSTKKKEPREEEAPEVEAELEEDTEPTPSPTPQPEEIRTYVEERLYMVPFKGLVYTPHNKRAKKAVRLLQAFAAKHMKSEVIVVDEKINQEIWKQGIQKPPRRLRVKLAKDKDGYVYILPAS